MFFPLHRKDEHIDLFLNMGACKALSRLSNHFQGIYNPWDNLPVSAEIGKIFKDQLEGNTTVSFLEKTNPIFF